MKKKIYLFEEIDHCEMCGSPVAKHIVLGQRLNQSQGFAPKSKTGISVSIKKCTCCGLIYSSPQPVPFDIQDHYGTPPEEYWKPAYFEWTCEYFAAQISEVKKLLPFREGMKALDIGAGLGKSMISLTKAGFDTYGFEPSIPFYERAISKMDISPDRLKLGMIENVDYDENTFDFITFGAVFEHLYHPAASLEKALKWLKPNGIIQIEVPSSKHLIAKIINIYFKLRGTNYVTNLSPMHSPFHLYEFGYKSFEHLAGKFNFKIEKHKYDVATIDFVPKLLQPIFKKYMEWTNTGMQLTVYLRKTPDQRLNGHAVNGHK
jgi:ubiquinone/menaquinone biosynthesis C-methylase UbiE